jgi:flagellar protein FlaF
MQNSTSEPVITPPNSASSAYGAIIRHTESPREIEYRVFEQVTSALEVAERPGAHFMQRIRATHDNRGLWQTLACDLAGEDNGFPAPLKANLISLAVWVTRETDRVMTEGGSLLDLIDINRTIMQGLRPAARGDN